MSDDPFPLSQHPDVRIAALTEKAGRLEALLNKWMDRAEDERAKRQAAESRLDAVMNAFTKRQTDQERLLEIQGLLFPSVVERQSDKGESIDPLSPCMLSETVAN